MERSGETGPRKYRFDSRVQGQPHSQVEARMIPLYIVYWIGGFLIGYGLGLKNGRKRWQDIAERWQMAAKTWEMAAKEWQDRP